MFTTVKRAFFALFICLVAAAGIGWGQVGARAAGGDAKKYEYKGIWIGMTADAVRTKLGNPKDKSDTQDMYMFSDNETVQFYYNPEHQVHAMMITFSGDLKLAPSAKDIFGQEVAPKADGGIFKMERYQKEGYWISYNRTAGADSIVTIAVQKI